MKDGKYIQDAPNVQLYNLKDDMEQSKNLATTKPEKLAVMRASYNAFIKTKMTRKSQ